MRLSWKGRRPVGPEKPTRRLGATPFRAESYPMLRLVHPAPKGQENTRPKGRKSNALTPTPEEQQRIRAALRHLRIAYGGYDVLAAVIGVPSNSLANNNHRNASYALAVLLARAAGVTVEQILRPGVQEAGKCPVCGRKGAR